MNERRIQILFVILGVFAAVLFFLTPVLYMVVTGFSDSADFLGPRSIYSATVEHFSAIFTGKQLRFLAFLRNSLIVSLISAVLCVSISTAAAYAITRIPFRGNMTLMLIVLAISMFPQISLAGYLFRLISSLGWINTYQGLIFPYTAWIMPLTLWILVSYFAQIPRELDKAAKVDGCNRLQILIRVIFPVALPGVFSTALLAFIFAFNEFMFALMLTTDYQARTVPVGIALFEGLHGEVPWSTIMAAATITTAPVVALTLLFQRYIIQGLTRGAIKG